ITCVQFVLVPAPPEKSTAPVGKYTAPPRYCVAPPLNLNVVPTGMLRPPYIRMPAKGAVEGGVRLMVAPPLIVAVGQSLIVLDVKTMVTPLPCRVPPPLTVKLPPSTMKTPGLNVTSALALNCIPPQ